MPRRRRRRRLPGERAFDIYSRLLRERIVCVNGPIDDATSNVIIAQLLYLESQHPEKSVGGRLCGGSRGPGGSPALEWGIELAAAHAGRPAGGRAGEGESGARAAGGPRLPTPCQRPRAAGRQVHMYINSPGGVVTAGLAIYDTMQARPGGGGWGRAAAAAAAGAGWRREADEGAASAPRQKGPVAFGPFSHAPLPIPLPPHPPTPPQYIKSPISTLCIGQAASMASLLLAAGAPGERRCLPHARIMVHQPIGGAQVGRHGGRRGAGAGAGAVRERGPAPAPSAVLRLRFPLLSLLLVPSPPFPSPRAKPATSSSRPRRSSGCAMC
jgi:ATP-dependent protease ClpP protease subunit